MVPQGVQPRPWLLPLTSPFSLQDPDLPFLSKVASVQCCGGPQVFWVNHTAPLLFLQLNPYLRFYFGVS